MSHTKFACGLLLMAALGACASDTVTPRSIDVTRADVKAAVSSNHALARALAEVFREEPGNVVYSPLSLEAVLGMLYAGARGETANQLGTLLGAAEAPELLHHGLGLLLEDLGGDHGYTLDLANVLFVDASLSVLPSYANVLRDAYRAPQQTLDYSDAEAARSHINRWVSERTQREIPELLQPSDVTSATGLNVVNALSFKAAWQHGFDPAMTRDGAFQRGDGSSVTVPMMHLAKTKVRCASQPGGTLIELPYRSGEISFLAWLPQHESLGPGTVPPLDDVLVAAQLPRLVSQLEEVEATVTLPRFTLRTRYDLIPKLQALGVRDLFDSSRADLSGIDGTRSLSVHPFLQEALIRVDEQGTVAVAATTAGVLRSAPPSFRFIHPFAFFIYDNRSASVLFTGRVLDPSEDDGN